MHSHLGSESRRKFVTSILARSRSTLRLHRSLGLPGHGSLLGLNELGVVDVAILVLVVGGLEKNSLNL